MAAEETSGAVEKVAADRARHTRVGSVTAVTASSLAGPAGGKCNSAVYTLSPAWRLAEKKSSRRYVSLSPGMGVRYLALGDGVLVFGLTECAAGLLRTLALLCLAMLIAGAAWIVFISLFNVLVFNQAPDSARARVLAVSLLGVQGAMAAGSAIWGGLALKTGIHAALMWAGVGTIASKSLGLFLRV